MRSVSIRITCDCCEEAIEEETEGSSSVTITVRGVEREMDICDTCLHGTFLQEARAVAKTKKTKDLSCYCGKSFTTERGLKAHQTRQAHD